MLENVRRENWLEQSGRKMKDEQESGGAAWSFEPGTLTAVDLSCPFVGENAACSLSSL